MLSLLAGLCLPAAAQQDSTGGAFVNQVIELGANKNFTRAVYCFCFGHHERDSR